MKKRMLSWILVLCLALGLCPLGALAADEDTAPEALGELRLTLRRSGAVAETAFTATLVGDNGQRQDDITALRGQTECALHVSHIADGTYTLTLAAPGYVTYTQRLEFDGRCVQLTLYDHPSVNSGRTEADGLFGVMPAGDVNADGVIDDADADAVTAAMGAAGGLCDLDGSGTVDLADLAIVVRNAARSATPATPVHTVSSLVLAQSVAAQTEEGTTVSGSDLADLLDQQKEDTVVELAPAQEGPISEENPVVLALPTSFDLTADEGSDEARAQAAAAPVHAQAIYIAAPQGSGATISAGEVQVDGVDEAGHNVTIKADIARSASPAAPDRAALMSAEAADVTVEQDGSVVIDLGDRVAIKKVTIRVTATADQGNLAEIAKVEFLSDFSERIPEPQLSIPEVRSVTNTQSDGLGYKDLTVTWTPQPNVTGYEVSVTGPGYNKTAATADDHYTFMGDSFNGTVLSFQTYEVKVRSVSGDWRSDWSQPYSHTVVCTKVPPAPQYVTVTPRVQSLAVSWNCQYDAQWFTLYYKAAGDAAFTPVENLTASSHILTNLTGGERYTVYVVAHNQNGASPKSANAEGTPLTPTGVVLPKYKLLNVNGSDGTAMTHIASITGNTSKNTVLYGGEDWTVLADNDPTSYVNIGDWDNGVAYGGFAGPEVTLDGVYTFDTVRFAPYEGEVVNQYAAKLAYRDDSGSLVLVDAALNARYDALSRKYYEVVAVRPITADHFQLRTRTFNTAPITISELKVYSYDDLEAQVAALFADEARVTLKDTVTKAQVDALVERVNTPDPVSGELHPHKDMILADLNYALTVLADSANLAKLYEVDAQLTAVGSPANGMAMPLSDYQPLGFVAGAGDTLVIYVSDLDSKTARGDNTELNLIATQFHPQVSAWQSTVTRLKAGRNEVTIPKIGSDATERGGSLYVQYTGARGARRYAVRVSGAAPIPVLRLDGVTGEARTAAIAAYVNELRDYVSALETGHAGRHAASDNANLNAYAYDPKNCVLNATEIEMDNMLWSLPASEVWRAISADPAGRLADTIAAMEQQIDYFYQFKGMNRAAEGADAYPFTRLNIRYHQMFTGAFMYAGGKHIGIEFGSTSSVLTLSPIVADADGKYQSGSLSGWGIAHEIGHCINAAAYQRVEVTNNVFAQLAKTGDSPLPETNANFRTTYDQVYKAVATGRTGHTGDLAVQLAMYWQLHLAYDNDYAFKFYDTVEAQQAGLFYARLESLLRDHSKADPALPNSSGDQLFMQACCAAAGRNVLDFFTAWGFTPDETTLAYAANFAKETRKIQYIDDDSRLYRLEGKPGMSAGAAVTASVVNATDRRINGNRVEIDLGCTNTNPDAMLGYEIARNGRVVAFVPASQSRYVDILTTENNRAFVYTVTGVDRLLRETAPLSLGQVKVCHDGAIDKSGWRAETNMTSPKDTPVTRDENDPEGGVVSGSTLPQAGTVSAIGAALDNDPATVYFGKSGPRPVITLDLGGVEQVTALKFTPAPASYTGDAAGDLAAPGDLYKHRLFGYTLEVSLDGRTWETVKEGEAYTGSAAQPDSWVKQSDVIYNADGSYTLFFCKKNSSGGLDPFLYTYDAAYIRLTATNMSTLAVAELDVLGPTGDNVELIEEGMGKLKEDYTAGSYADGTPCVIPAGSAVFYGAYRGDPSYNVVLLKDQKGKVLDGSQLIFAEVPEQGALGETCDGRWLFWLEDADKVDDLGDTYNEFDQLDGLATVQAELYRVQDAMTLAGQRVTSTSLTLEVPAVLPDLTITAQADAALYFPDAGAVRAAMAAPAAAALPDLPAPRGYYADTGAAETDAPSPVALTAKAGAVDFTAAPDAIAVALRLDFTLDPAGAAQVSLTRRSGLYQTKRYDAATGALTVFAVARSGNLGGKTVSGSVSSLAAGTTLTALSLGEVDGLYTARDVALTASAEALEPSGTGTGTPGGGHRPSGGAPAAPSAPQPAAKTPFADVAPGIWYEDAVAYVYEKGMMVGTSATAFTPDAPTSRAMVVTVLWRLAGSPAPAGAAGPDCFTDVPAGQWYTDAVAWATGEKVVNGMGDGTFRPEDPVTREQMATLLQRFRAWQLKAEVAGAASSLAPFADASAVSAYAVGAMAWAVEQGLINGMGDGTLAPQGQATRAQAAALLSRFHALIAP